MLHNQTQKMGRIGLSFQLQYKILYTANKNCQYKYAINLKYDCCFYVLFCLCTKKGRKNLTQTIYYCYVQNFSIGNCYGISFFVGGTFVFHQKPIIKLPIRPNLIFLNISIPLHEEQRPAIYLLVSILLQIKFPCPNVYT